MSYCRWSSDNFKCDLYCYKDNNNNYITHVANNRIVGNIPEVPSILKVTTLVFTNATRAQNAFLKTAKHEPIGLPHDGKDFKNTTLKEFLARIRLLKAIGYKVPAYVLINIKDEITNGKT